MYSNCSHYLTTILIEKHLMRIMDNGNDPPAHISFLEISDENMHDSNK